MDAKNTAVPEDSSQNLDAAALAELERVAAKTIDLGARKWGLCLSVLLFVVALGLPHMRGVAGWQVVVFSAKAHESGIALAEYCFYALGVIGVVIFNAATVIFKRTWMSYVAWIFSCVALVYALFAVWMRHTAPNSQVTSVSVGMLLAALATLISVWVLSNSILARSDRQHELKKLRAQAIDTEFSPYLLDAPQTQSEDNSLLVDDRRARAFARHRRNNRGSDNEES